MTVTKGLERYALPVALFVGLLMLSRYGYADASLSGMDSSLGEVSRGIEGLLTGPLGKVVGFVALLWATISCVFKFNVMTVLSLLGVIVLLVFGSSIIDGVFG